MSKIFQKTVSWVSFGCVFLLHYSDVIMGAIGFEITSLTIVYSTVYSGADRSKHQSSTSLAFVWGIHQGPVNSPHKWPVTGKMFPFDHVIMMWLKFTVYKQHSAIWYGLHPWHWCYWRYGPGLMLGLHPANERRRYFVTTTLIGWVQA